MIDTPRTKAARFNLRREGDVVHASVAEEMEREIITLTAENARLVARVAEMQTELTVALSTEEESLDFCIGLTGTSPDKIRAAFDDSKALAAEQEKVRALNERVTEFEKQISADPSDMDSYWKNSATKGDIAELSVHVTNALCRLRQSQGKGIVAGLEEKIETQQAIIKDFELWQERDKKAIDEVSSKLVDCESRQERMRAALRTYYGSLNAHENSHVAAVKFVHEAGLILGMKWKHEGGW